MPASYPIFPRHFMSQGLVAFASLALVTAVGFSAAQAQGSKAAGADFKTLAEQAEKASHEDRLDDAAGLYRKALALRPGWSQGWWSLGTIEYDRDDYTKAALDFEKVITLDAKNGTAHAMLGLCQFELGKEQPALKNLLAAEQFGIVKNEELRKVALYHLGVLQLRAGKYGAAKETLGQLAKNGVRTKELVTGLGQAALLVKPQEAPPTGSTGEGVIERAGEAEWLLGAKNYDGAKEEYAHLTQEFPEYPNLHFAFGRLLLETNEKDEAVDEFQRELKRDPQNVNALVEIAAVRYQVDSQDGLQYAEQAVKLAPALPLAHYLLGLLRLDTGNAAGAIPELEFAQKAFPKESRVYFALGTAYSRVGRKPEAAKARAEFAKLNAQEATRPGPNVYAGRSTVLTEGQLQGADQEKPHR